MLEVALDQMDALHASYGPDADPDRIAGLGASAARAEGADPDLRVEDARAEAVASDEAIASAQVTRGDEAFGEQVDTARALARADAEREVAGAGAVGDELEGDAIGDEACADHAEAGGEAMQLRTSTLEELEEAARIGAAAEHEEGRGVGDGAVVRTREPITHPRLFDGAQ